MATKITLEVDGRDYDKFYEELTDQIITKEYKPRHLQVPGKYSRKFWLDLVDEKRISIVKTLFQSHAAKREFYFLTVKERILENNKRVVNCEALIKALNYIGHFLPIENTKEKYSKEAAEKLWALFLRREDSADKDIISIALNRMHKTISNDYQNIERARPFQMSLGWEYDFDNGISDSDKGKLYSYMLKPDVPSYKKEDALDFLLECNAKLTVDQLICLFELPSQQLSLLALSNFSSLVDSVTDYKNAKEHAIFHAAEKGAFDIAFRLLTEELRLDPYFSLRDIISIFSHPNISFYENISFEIGSVFQKIAIFFATTDNEIDDKLARDLVLPLEDLISSCLKIDVAETGEFIRHIRQILKFFHQELFIRIQDFLNLNLKETVSEHLDGRTSLYLFIGESRRFAKHCVKRDEYTLENFYSYLKENNKVFLLPKSGEVKDFRFIEFEENFALFER